MPKLEIPRKDTKPHTLEDYEPGATRSQVLRSLSKYAKGTKPLPKHAQPPAQA